MTMTLELNDKAICDEMLALTALRNVARGGGDGAEETSGDAGGHLLLTADMLPGLRNMIRLMFADTVMEMASVVEGCSMGEEDPDPALPYSNDRKVMGLKVEIDVALPSGLALAAKRQWEHVVAAKVLEALATERDGAFASMLHSQHRSALEALKEVLEDVASDAGRIVPHWW